MKLRKAGYVLLNVSLSAILFAIVGLIIWPYYVGWRTDPTRTPEETPLITENATLSALPLYDPLQFQNEERKAYRLRIPKLKIDAIILEGETLAILSKYEGVWHEPPSVAPDQQGNMVIAGHRFQYLPPNTNTFYHLDKLKNGDPVFVDWEGTTYRYEVFQKSVVKGTQVSIRDNDPAIPHELTLYTCTPLGSKAKRLVIEARLKETSTRGAN